MLEQMISKDVTEREGQRNATLDGRYGSIAKESSWAFQHRKDGEQIKVSKLVGGI